MQLSGNYTLSMSYQSGVNASFNCIFGSGAYQFGFTGLSGFAIDFYVSGSKIFDTNRDFIYSAPYQEPVNLEVFSNASVASFYANGELLSYYTTGAQFPMLTGFFSKSNEYYENTFYVSGEPPLLQYSGVNDFDIGVDVITGLILNLTPLRKFRIANFRLVEDSIPLTFISGWQTGDIAESGEVYIASLLDEADRTGILKTKLETNFGVFDLDINLATNANDNSDKLSLWPQDSFFEQYQSKTYILESEHNFGSRILDVRLDHISGGSQYPYYVSATGTGTGYFSGEVVRYGNVTGAISGYLEHGVYETGLVSKYYIITGLVEGAASGNLTANYAGTTINQNDVLSGYSITFTSGDSGYRYFGVGTGLITGVHHHITGTGVLSFPTSGIPTSWSGAVNSTISGESQEESGFLYKTKYGAALTPYDNPSTFLTNETWFEGYYFYDYSGSPQYSGITGTHHIYTGYVGTPGHSSGYFSYDNNYEGTFISLEIFPPLWSGSTVVPTGTGNFGELELTTGLYEVFESGLSGEALITTGLLPFTGVWDLYTGTFHPNISSFRDNGWVSGTGYYMHTGVTPILPPESTTSIVEVFYDGRDSSGVNIAKLKYSDGILSGELLISGVGKAI